MTTDERQLDPFDVNWESVRLRCHSQYELLGLVLSILGRAPLGASRRDHHLPLLILCVRFIILAAGNKPKSSAPYLVSIMFTEDDGDFKVQVACDVPQCPGLEDLLDGKTITDGPGLNVIMGSTILQGKTDLPKENAGDLRRSMVDARCDFLVNEGGYVLPEKNAGDKVCTDPAQRLSIPNLVPSAKTCPRRE